MITSRMGSRVLKGLAAVAMLIPTVAAGTPVGAVALPPSAISTPRPAVATPSPQAAYGALPLRFDANRGQANSAVLFEANAAGLTAVITSSGAALRLLATPSVAPQRPTDPTHSSKFALSQQPSSPVLQIQLVGGNTAARPAAVQRLGGLSNYLIGAPAAWRTGVPGYGEIIYRSAYSGIDLLYHGSPALAGFEYDFAVHAGGNPSLINVALAGATSLHLDVHGNLVIAVGGLNVLQLRPLAYQVAYGVRHAITATYVLRGGNKIGFKVGAFNHSFPLIIDPVITYSTYLGGAGFDDAYGVAVDSSGSAYLTGITASTDFPTAASVYGPNPSHARVFVSKLNATGTALVYSTYIGGSGDEEGLGIAVDSSGHAFVAGTTTSSNFPLVSAAQGTFAGASDAFVAELNAAGSGLTYSTYLGGAGVDLAYGVA
ncbi:MAG TPA: SBBP repeat-containing protein, partial [Clostridia bacterium]|nr:SBBP repeat-containing protein [Clostridia bacterium]